MGRLLEAVVEVYCSVARWNCVGVYLLKFEETTVGFAEVVTVIKVPVRDKRFRAGLVVALILRQMLF